MRSCTTGTTLTHVAEIYCVGWWLRPWSRVSVAQPGCLPLLSVSHLSICLQTLFAVYLPFLTNFTHACPCVWGRRDDGVGLAAPQVGLNLRLMVFNPTGERGGEEVVLVNPKVITSGGGRDSYDEGCLSFPRIFGHVMVRTCYSVLYFPGSCLNDASFKPWVAAIVS